MMEEIAEKIVKAQSKKPYMFIIVFAVITLLLMPGIFNLVNNVEPSLEKVLPPNIQELETMNDMRTQFGADMVYLLVHAESPVNDVRNPDLIKYLDTLSQRVETIDYVRDVSSLSDIVNSNNDHIIPDSLPKVKHILSKDPRTEDYLNPDRSLTIVRITSDTGASASVIKEIINNIDSAIENSEPQNPGSRIELTGYNAIDKVTFETIISDFKFITLISMLLVMLVVWLTFGSFSKGILPMVVVMNALLWTMGIAGYLGLTLTVVSMVSAAMIMGLGIDFGIHVVYNYFDFRKKKGPDDSLKETMKELFRAMLGASLTTTAGFLALLFGVLPAMRTLGIILALGILNTLLGAILLLPVIVYLYDTSVIKSIVKS